MCFVKRGFGSSGEYPNDQTFTMSYQIVVQKFGLNMKSEIQLVHIKTEWQCQFLLTRLNSRAISPVTGSNPRLDETD